MRKILSLTCVNLKRTVISVKFPAAIALYLLLLFYALTDLYDESGSVVYFLHFVLEYSTVYLCVTICSMPNAAIFADDWCSGKFLFSYIRSGKKQYSVSLIIAAFLTAFLVAFLGCILFIVILSFKHPLMGDLNDISFIQLMEVCLNGGLLHNGHVLLYYIAAAGTQGCLAGLFSALSVMISIIITNSYITLVMPLLLFEVITNILSFLKAPLILNPYYIYVHGSQWSQYFNNDIDVLNNFSVMDLMYPFIYAAFFTVLITIVSHFLIKRKYECNSDLR